MLEELKPEAAEVLDVPLGPGDEIVEADDVTTLTQEPLAKMRSEEAGSPLPRMRIVRTPCDRCRRKEPAMDGQRLGQWAPYATIGPKMGDLNYLPGACIAGPSG